MRPRPIIASPNWWDWRRLTPALTSLIHAEMQFGTRLDSDPPLSRSRIDPFDRRANDYFDRVYDRRLSG